MYTSGSTGKPKGVSVIHRGVVRLVKQTNYANLSAEEKLLQLAPISFDASTFEIWGSLLNGARLVVMPASVTMEPSIQGLDGMSKWKVLPVPPKCELWDEKIPIELYISSPTEDSQTIEIEGYCRTDLFPNQSLEHLFSDYQEILQKLVEFPATKLSEF